MMRLLRVSKALTALLLTILMSVSWADEPTKKTSPSDPKQLFDRSNLVAWCIVPFDASRRSPAERAEMVRELGLHRVAYDWRARTRSNLRRGDRAIPGSRHRVLCVLELA